MGFSVFYATRTCVPDWFGWDRIEASNHRSAKSGSRIARVLPVVLYQKEGHQRRQSDSAPPGIVLQAPTTLSGPPDSHGAVRGQWRNKKYVQRPIESGAVFWGKGNPAPRSGKKADAL